VLEISNLASLSEAQRIRQSSHSGVSESEINEQTEQIEAVGRQSERLRRQAFQSAGLGNHLDQLA